MNNANNNKNSAPDKSSGSSTNFYFRCNRCRKIFQSGDKAFDHYVQKNHNFDKIYVVEVNGGQSESSAAGNQY